MKNKNMFTSLIIILFVLRVIFSFTTWHPDLNNHVDWGIRLFEYGANKFYAPESNVWNFTWPNQPPGSIYIFAGIRKIFEFVFNIFWQLNVKIPAFPSIIISYFELNLYPALLKLPAILSDFGIAYLIYKITNKKWASVVWLINPVVWYNSTIWGQYDAVINFFALLSFYLLIKRRLIFGVLAFALSIYIKASLLPFAPIFLIIAIRQNYKIKDWALSILVTSLIIVALTLPFSHGNPITWLYDLYTKKIFVQQLHVITANAFNLWSGIAGIHERPDSLPFLWLTYQTWGTILFTVFYVPLLFSVYKNQKQIDIVWILALTAFASFTLMTNMHERYLYPLFPYLTILIAFGYVNLISYLTISLITFLGMYNIWFVPRIEPVVSFLSFGNSLMPRVLGFLMFAMFLNLYKLYNGYTNHEK
jgi:Gpi18-like mannosyltransferase